MIENVTFQIKQLLRPITIKAVLVGREILPQDKKDIVGYIHDTIDNCNNRDLIILCKYIYGTFN